MNKRPGQQNVTTQVGYCSFCTRPRNLRREERQLGTLVRTTVTCETCHRTLESSVSVAESAPPAAEEEAVAPEPEARETGSEAAEPKPARKAGATRATATGAGSAGKARTGTTARRTAKGK
jgi:hypothetical protein